MKRSGYEGDLFNVRSFEKHRVHYLRSSPTSLSAHGPYKNCNVRAFKGIIRSTTISCKTALLRSTRTDSTVVSNSLERLKFFETIYPGEIFLSDVALVAKEEMQLKSSTSVEREEELMG